MYLHFYNFGTYFPLGSGMLRLECDSGLPVAGVAASCLPVGMLCVATRLEMCGVVGLDWRMLEAGGSGLIGLCIKVAGTCATWLMMVELDEVEG